MEKKRRVTCKRRPPKRVRVTRLDGGIGWELLTSMVRYKARQRTSAKAALAHPYFDKEGLLALSIMQNLRLQFFRATQQDYSEAVIWIIQLMARSGTKKDGGFTEAQLQELSTCDSICH
ncbi:putative non-specific serine/threonine protein kinase [Helianthus debilis subsp. tardiflorus]